jgi:hypothetical protein
LSDAARPRLGPGIVAGLAFSVPVALRAGLPSPTAVVLGLAAASLVVVPVGLWIRHGNLKNSASADRALVDGAALSSLPLALFGGVLKSGTHHRPLGGATFAVGACVVIACCIALAFRVGSGAKAHWLKHFFSVCCWSSLALTVIFAAGKTHILLDFLTLAAACVAAGLLRIPLALSRVSAPAALAVWVLLLGGGLLLRQAPEQTSALRQRAPISFASLSWLGDGS